MAYLVLEDFGGQVEVLVFPRVYERCRDWLFKDQVLLVEGRVDREEEGVKVLADHLERLPKDEMPSLYLKIEEGRGLKELQMVLAAHPGPHPVYFYFPEKRRRLLAKRKYWVTLAPPLLKKLVDILGQDRVKVIPGK
jgi:DNA polymerase-3 subunit alpha